MRKHARKAVVFALLALLLGIAALLHFGPRTPQSPVSPSPTASDDVTPIAVSSPASPAKLKEIQKTLGALPLTFELNKGQSTPQVIYQARGHGYGLFLGEGAAFLMLKNHANLSKRNLSEPFEFSHIHEYEGTTTFLKLTYVNANLNANIHGVGELETRTNYFKGPESNWVSNVPNFQKVCYDEIYPGIDMVYYGNEGGLEYDYVVKPGADPSVIALEIGNAKKLEVAPSGDLLIRVNGGMIHKGKPVIYQEIDGARKVVEGSYVLQSDNRIGFKLGAYDHDHALVIDPSIVWSTYLADNSAAQALNNFGLDIGFGIAVDSAGKVYVTGTTDSYDFPQSNSLAYKTLNNFATPSASGSTTDSFISCLSADGSQLVFSSWFGGTASDGGMAVAVDTSGAVYFTGYAGNGIFPVKNPRFTYSGSAGKTDAFLTKLSPGGTSVVYSTFIGGSADDVGLGVAADSKGNAYVVGMTKSTDFPVKAALISAPTSNTAGFMAKFSPDGSNVIFSTYINGSGAGPMTRCNSVALDPFGNVYVGGTTDGLNPALIKNAFQSGFKGNPVANTNGFVLKTDGSGAVAIFGSYLGDTGPDGINGIGADGQSRIFVTGFTKSASFPTQSPNQGTLGGAGAQNAFFTIFANTGQSLAYSTYLGGSGVDVANGIAVDPDGYAYIIGTTSSANFPVQLAQQPPIQSGNAGQTDAFIAKYNPTGGEIFATYLGSSGPDQGHGIATGVKGSSFEGDTYITGEAGGRNGTFGTLGSFDSQPGATNPGFFLTDTVTGNATMGTNTITGITDTSGLAAGWTLLVTTGGFSAGDTILTVNDPHTITMSTNSSATTSATYTFQAPTITPAPDCFVTHIGDLSPRITSPNTIIAAINQPIPTYTITATNNPTSFGAAGLAGPSLQQSGTIGQTITGTPTSPSPPGGYIITLTATNAAGTGTLFLTVIVNGSAPQITSPNVATTGQGLGFSYSITASNNPTSFDAQGLPPGLSVDQLTGNISGTPTIAGSYPVTISATNNIGTGTATLTINVTPQPPIIVGSLAVSGSANAPFTYTISALNNPTSFSAAPLPNGLSLNTSTGVISGTPTTPGVTNVTLSATNAGGTSVVTPTLVITIDNKPVINSPLTANASVNSPFSYTITAFNAPTTFSAVGLPPGLNIAGAVISGSPTLAGVFTITLGATNASGTGQAILTLSVSPGPPVITSSNTATFAVNAPVTYTITGTNSPTSFAASNLPQGLTVDTSTGIISGSVNAVGSFNVTISASNSAGSSAPVTVKFTITASPPIITSSLAVTGSVNSGFTYTITSLGSAPQTYTASPLPPGLTFTGTQITGVPTVEGTYAVTLTATNSLGSDTKVLVISISNVISSITEIDSDGDGFPDELEIGVGSDPKDPKSTPFGGAPAGAKHVINITSMQIKLDFSSATSTKDTITLKGTIPVPAGFKGDVKDIAVDVGGVVRQFGTLGATTPAGAKDSFKLKVTTAQDPSGLPFRITKVPSTIAQVANFQVKLANGNFKPALFDEGLVGTSQIKDPAARTVDVFFLFTDFQGFYQSAKVLQYTVHGKTGQARNGKQ